MKIKKKITQSQTAFKKIGNAPLAGYRVITKEEARRLRKMTLKESIEQTEILLQATRWMK